METIGPSASQLGTNPVPIDVGGRVKSEGGDWGCLRGNLCSSPMAQSSTLSTGARNIGEGKARVDSG